MTGLLEPQAPKSQERGVEIITFGCRLNAYESEVIRRHATEAGLEDTIIVNTCAVTKEAERQARQAIRKARRRNKTARLVVTGCAAQINPGAFAAMPEVDQVLGNAEKLEARNFGAPPGERVIVNDIMSVRETAGHLIEGFDGRARAFLQVQNGCDHRCTFCVIPSAAVIRAACRWAKSWRRPGCWPRRVTAKSCSAASTSALTERTCRGNRLSGRS